MHHVLEPLSPENRPDLSLVPLVQPSVIRVASYELADEFLAQLQVGVDAQG